MSDGLHIWSALETTDPAFTKNFKKGGGFSGTDINPMWRWRRLTERFGPCGAGWKYRVVEHGIHHPGDEIVVWVLAELSVVGGDGEWNDPIPAFGGSKLLEARNSGKSFVNDEAWKMALTDALGKASSMLGLCADVYLGAFDGSKYATPAPSNVGDSGFDEVPIPEPPPKPARKPRKVMEDAQAAMREQAAAPAQDEWPEQAAAPSAGPERDPEYDAKVASIRWEDMGSWKKAICPRCRSQLYDNRPHEYGDPDNPAKYPAKGRAPWFTHKKGDPCDFVVWPPEWHGGGAR